MNAFLDDPNVPLIFVVSGFLAASSSMQRPSREALMPRTVQHDQIVAANSLTSLGMQIGVLVGPAVGGLLIAFIGIGWCFVVDICGLAVATLLFVAMRPYPHRAETTPPSLAGIGEGVRYAFKRRDLLGTYLVDIAAMFLAMPVVLFPALAEEVFDQPEVLGLLYSAETVGALLATALSGWTGRIHHHGRAIVIAAAAYGGFVGDGRPDAERVADAGVLHAQRRGRHDLRRLPRHGLEPDHPREHARPAGRHRDAVLLGRPARRPGPGRRHRRPLERPRRHRQRRLRLRRRRHPHRRCACATSGGYDERTDPYAQAERAVRAAHGEVVD